MTHTGYMKLYFSSHNDAPRVCAISDLDDTWELLVKHLTVRVPCRSYYGGKTVKTPDHSGPPCFWLECFGTLTLERDGAAVIAQSDCVEPQPSRADFLDAMQRMRLAPDRNEARGEKLPSEQP